MTPETALLLTILSVLALWTLLGVLTLGLLFILKPLQSVRQNLERIAMGVRAIERQSASLGESAAETVAAFERTSREFGEAREVGNLGQLLGNSPLG